MLKTISFLKIKLRRFSLLSSFLILSWATILSQEVSGNLKHYSNQELQLLGYSGFQTIELAKTSIDASGDFILSYSDYKGMGYIETADQSQLFLVLNEPKINISGTHLKEPDGIKFSNSKENLLFSQYTEEHTQREQALAGWKYLLPQYKKTELFKQQKKSLAVIKNEIDRLEKQDHDFLEQLDQSTYVSWFLPKWKLLNNIPQSVKLYTERIQKHISDFRNIDFNNPQLYHSGIMDDLIESHYWLIENGGMNMDSMYIQMNLSTDHLLNNLEESEELLNQVGNFLFKLFEKRSLYTASEYLSLKLLTEGTCTLDDNLARQMETYRAMKVGNTAPDITFEGTKMLMGNEIAAEIKLSDINSDYTLVVFGASWCSTCSQEIPRIKDKYLQWKLKGLETVFISLDQNESEFKEFVKDFPFLSSCDFKGWKNKTVQDYYVFALPTLFLLDNKKRILVRPSSIEQVDAWVNYKIQSKN